MKREKVLSRVAIVLAAIVITGIASSSADSRSPLFIKMLSVAVGSIAIYIIIMREADIIRRDLEKEAEEYKCASHNPLIGLPSETLIKEKFNRLFHRWQKNNLEGGAAIFLSLSELKKSDAILAQAANRIEENVRPADIVGHFGEDKLVIILTQLKNKNDIQRVAARIKKAFGSPLESGKEAVVVKPALGFATSSGEYSTPEAMLESADIAMYGDKARIKKRKEE